MTWDFHREVAENSSLLNCYAASSGKFLTDVSGQPIGPIVKGKKSPVLISTLFIPCISINHLSLLDPEDLGTAVVRNVVNHTNQHGVTSQNTGILQHRICICVTCFLGPCHSPSRAIPKFTEISCHGREGVESVVLDSKDYPKSVVEVDNPVLSVLNLLKTKRNLLYIRNQSVPRSKHLPPRL